MSNEYIARNIQKRIAANLARNADDNAYTRISVQPTKPLVEDPEAMDRRRNAATRLHELWASLIPEGTPDITTFYDWADRFGLFVSERATKRTAEKARSKRRTPGEQPFTADGAARYASVTMRNMSGTPVPFAITI